MFHSLEAAAELLVHAMVVNELPGAESPVANIIFCRELWLAMVNLGIQVGTA